MATPEVCCMPLFVGAMLTYLVETASLPPRYEHDQGRPRTGCEEDRRAHAARLAQPN